MESEERYKNLGIYTDGQGEFIRKTISEYQSDSHCCSKRCCSSWKQEDIQKHIMEMESLSKVEKKMVVLTVLRNCAINSEGTRYSEKRQRLRFSFRYEPFGIMCVSAFRAIFGLRIETFRGLLAHLRSKGAKYRVEQKSDQIIYKSNIGNIENKYEQKYFALVIGNSKYNSLFLKNPVNDARDLSHILMKKGFSVILRLNTTRKEMIDAIRKFGNASGVGLFYFAGLGVQMNGKLYIVPIDAQVHSEPDIKYECISLDFISDDLNKNRVKPYNGQLFAYSTSSDQAAYEGERNGIYSKHLLKNLIINGLEIHQMFRNVREAVEKETKGRQTSQELSTAKKSFYFTPLYKNDFEGSFFIFILDTQRNNPYSRYR
ncbi:MAG: peptidase C14 caspase catalytic subunit P20 [Candidatus Magnetoglobus multicellularis str. Araruama]|uniref:Peptidase C14 caspase catalytic subunit P20 n=1 Tax=Candidatus Magnetoglobus multicellularis str. Araruama TaxID=890399 RepID=A0A1V1PAD7_9BACT|nr:MAG: peptidase C14 caspase catalytic subunit P20 [Candidatus Magnetoglobus multicellularis str. Araruama]